MSDPYDKIDRFLRNNLDDADYVEYSEALDTVYVGAKQAQPEPAAPAVEDTNLIGLLCLIHRDGGHYIQAHGLAKAVADAHEVLYLWREAFDAAPSVAPEPVAWKCVLLGEDQELDSAFFDTDPKFPFGEAGKHFSADYVVKKTPLFAHPPRAPLTEMKLVALIERHTGGVEISDDEATSMVNFARAVEAAHGIGAGRAG